MQTCKPTDPKRTRPRPWERKSVCVCVCLSFLDVHLACLVDQPPRLKGKDLLLPVDEHRGARRPLVAWKDQSWVQ